MNFQIHEVTAPTCASAGIHRRGALALSRHRWAGRAKHRGASILEEDNAAELSTRGAIRGEGRKRMYENEGVEVS